MFYFGFYHGVAGCSSGMSAKEFYGLRLSQRFRRSGFGRGWTGSVTADDGL